MAPVIKGELEWGELPPRSSGRAPRGSHKTLAAELKNNPGVWAPILTYDMARTSATIARVIRQGETAAWTPAGAYEAKARTVKGEHRVYARYVGETGEDAADA